jgi:hypothetical protein
VGRSRPHSTDLVGSRGGVLDLVRSSPATLSTGGTAAAAAKQGRAATAQGSWGQQQPTAAETRRQQPSQRNETAAAKGWDCQRGREGSSRAMQARRSSRRKGGSGGVPNAFTPRASGAVKS